MNVDDHNFSLKRLNSLSNKSAPMPPTPLSVALKYENENTSEKERKGAGKASGGGAGRRQSCNTGFIEDLPASYKLHVC